MLRERPAKDSSPGSGRIVKRGKTEDRREWFGVISFWGSYVGKRTER